MINLKLSKSSGSGNSVEHVLGKFSSFKSEIRCRKSYIALINIKYWLSLKNYIDYDDFSTAMDYEKNIVTRKYTRPQQNNIQKQNNG